MDEKGERKQILTWLVLLSLTGEGGTARKEAVSPRAGEAERGGRAADQEREKIGRTAGCRGGGRAAGAGSKEGRRGSKAAQGG
jgi:hypothetical protein